MSKFEAVECPECNFPTNMQVTRRMDAHSEEDRVHLDQLFEGKLNSFTCAKCKFRSSLDVPVVVILGKVILQYLPFDYLEQEGVRERLVQEIWGRDRWRQHEDTIEHMFSIDELKRRYVLHQVLRNHVQERVERFRTHQISPEVAERINGAYKKNKLRLISCVATFFEFQKDYTECEVDEIIGYALRYAEHTAEHCDPTHIRSALCELRFLARTRNGDRYWKTNPCDKSCEIG